MTDWLSYQTVQQRLAAVGYIAGDELAMALALALGLQRPLLLEGEAGVGKTEIARACTEFLDRELIRLQCYEGLDANAALYEWDYQRQLLSIRAHEAEGTSADELEKHIFSQHYLLRRPLLQAIQQVTPPVLLIDEIDRADEEFEAFLLEVLADFQVTIPELGTIRATTVPLVILTSNATRVLSDALRRRCLYCYVPFPDAEAELAILRSRQPGLEVALARKVVGFVQGLRKEDLEKKPGVAETLDWAAALAGLKITDPEQALDQVQASLACLLKTEADRQAVTPEVTSRLLGGG